MTMCWWIKVSVPLMYNLSVRLTDSVVDFFCGLVHCLTDVITGESGISVEVLESNNKKSCFNPARLKPTSIKQSVIDDLPKELRNDAADSIYFYLLITHIQF